jgi:choline kinase
MIGIIPASGKASRLNGLPKFALPYNNDGDSLIKRHVEKMKKHCDRVVVSTSSQWKDLLISFNLDIEIIIIEPSTMNDAVLKIADKYISDKYLIGMGDTYYEGENPYDKLSLMLYKNLITVACWKIDEELKGRVGQVKLFSGSILDVVDKKDDCNYSHMWGAIGLDRNVLLTLNKNNAHPGIDLPLQIKDNFSSHFAFEVDGKYFDVGTMSGYKELISRTV